MNNSNLTEDYFYNIFQSKNFNSISEDEAYYLVTKFKEASSHVYSDNRNYYDVIVKLNEHYYFIRWSCDECMDDKVFEWEDVYEVIPKKIIATEWCRKE